MCRRILLPCADGSGCNCERHVEADVSEGFYKLSPYEQAEIIGLANEKGGEVFEYVREGVYISLIPNTCGACGSDY